ncbi:MAG: hypothetical protein JXR37_35765 [Kiritimatiellae bacterium]|nr:hypothetical protein [Kiritimatiellia bacterium]
MADIEFHCPHCRTHLEVDQELANETLACPACNESLIVPSQSQPVRPPKPAEPPPEPAVKCQYCNADMAEDAVLCVKCGRKPSGEIAGESKAKSQMPGLVVLVVLLVVLLAAAFGLHMRKQARLAEEERKRQIEKEKKEQLEEARRIAKEEEQRRIEEQQRRQEEEQQRKLAEEKARQEDAARQKQIEEAESRKQAEEAAQREKIATLEQRIRDEFKLDEAQPAMQKVHLNDGSVLTVAAMQQDEDKPDYYALRVPNSTYTIYATQLVPKSSVVKTEKEDPAEAEWRLIRTVTPGEESDEPLYYEKAMELVFDAFLAKYPDSARRPEVEQLRATWDAELKRVADGHIKIKGRWYAPDEKRPEQMSPQTRYLLRLVHQQVANGQHEQAILAGANVKIPEGYEQEERQFAINVLNALGAWGANCQKQVEDLNAKRQEIEKRYENQEQDRLASYGPPRKQESEQFWQYSKRRRAWEREMEAKIAPILEEIRKQKQEELQAVEAELAQWKKRANAVCGAATTVREALRIEEAKTRVQALIVRIRDLPFSP